MAKFLSEGQHKIKLVYFCIKKNMVVPQSMDNYWKNWEYFIFRSLKIGENKVPLYSSLTASRLRYDQIWLWRAEMKNLDFLPKVRVFLPLFWYKVLFQVIGYRFIPHWEPWHHSRYLLFLSKCLHQHWTFNHKGTFSPFWS